MYSWSFLNFATFCRQKFLHVNDCMIKQKFFSSENNELELKMQRKNLNPVLLRTLVYNHTFMKSRTCNQSIILLHTEFFPRTVFFWLSCRNINKTLTDCNIKLMSQTLITLLFCANADVKTLWVCHFCLCDLYI